MSDQQLADLSNTLIASTMFVLVLAMVFFAAAFATRRAKAPTTVASADRVPALVGGGAAVDGDVPRADDGEPAGEPGRRAGNIAMALSWLAFALLTAGLISRGMWAGRVPWGNMYEFSLSSAAAALGVFLLVSLKRDVRWFGVFLIPAVLLTLGLAVTVLYTESAQLVPALDSAWLAIHVSAAIISGGAFTMGGLLALLYLMRERADRRGSRAGR